MLKIAFIHILKDVVFCIGNLDIIMIIEIITKEENPLKKHFGTHKFNRPTDEILDEGDKESWDE